MINWMQKHNKYLVWTIWVATIAFIGAGFVGWGSFDFGKKAGNIAKVGSIEIPQLELNMVYSDLYAQVNQQMQGQLDDKKAKELGLVQQAFARINTQAKVLNFAKDAGIIVSDTELSQTIEEIPAFQIEGQFNKEAYQAFLHSKRMRAKEFEGQLRVEMIISKTLALLNVDALPFEITTVSAAMNVADKLAYKVLTVEDVEIVPDDAAIKTFWETRKDNFMTDKAYELALVWTLSNDTEVTEDAEKSFYETNSFNYTDAEGKLLSFEDAKERVISDLKLKQTKKAAQINYINFKKGKLESSETLTLVVNDGKLTKEIWDDIQQKNISDITKPKVVDNKYATVKILKIIEPQSKSFEEAKNEVSALYTQQAENEALLTLADNTLKNFDESNATISDFVTLQTSDNLKSLNLQESLQFLQKLFTSSKENGIISLADKVIVYNIMDQKLEMMEENKEKLVKQTVNQVKQNIFQDNLIKMLDKKYPTEVYMEGLTN
jgi:peptidyl-prolyl cis-trans isomerase D